MIVKPIKPDEQSYSYYFEQAKQLEPEILLQKIKRLTIQLQHVSYDFENNINYLYDHQNLSQKIIELGNQILIKFQENKLKKFEELKTECKKIAQELKKLISKKFIKAIRILKKEKELEISIEKELKTITKAFQEYTIQHYKLTEYYVKKTIGLLKRKALTFKEIDLEEVEEDVHLLSVYNQLIELTRRLEYYIEFLNRLLNYQLEQLDYFCFKKGKAISEKELQPKLDYFKKLYKEIKNTIQNEKRDIYISFSELINKEKISVERLLSLIRKKEEKITIEDIKKDLMTFVKAHELHSYCSALYGALETNTDLFNKREIPKLKELCLRTINEYKKLEEVAETDKLLGIKNRRMFEITVKRIISKQVTFSILLLDIDHFKKFNDDYGHLIGDKVLFEIASVISKVIKIIDSVYRWGGEEFVVLFPNTILEKAKKGAERIRKAVQSHEVYNFEGERIRNVTMSGGLIEVRYDKEHNDYEIFHITMEKVVKTADELLYLAKQDGRNRIYCKKISELGKKPERV